MKQEGRDAKMEIWEGAPLRRAHVPSCPAAAVVPSSLADTVSGTATSFALMVSSGLSTSISDEGGTGRVEEGAVVGSSAIL